MTPQDIIVQVRDLIQDAREPLRYGDDVLLRFVNSAFSRAAVLRPDLFGVVGELSLAAGDVVQSSPAGALRFIELFQVKGGSAITETTRVELSRYMPGWMIGAPGAPINFMRYPRNPTKFFVYPRPVPGVIVIGEWAMSPEALALTDLAPLPDAYLPVMIDGVVAQAEIVDNEHVENGRAKFFAERFEQTLIAGLKTREITDFEHAGTEPETQKRVKTQEKTFAP